MPKLMPAKLRRAEYLVVMSVVCFIVMALIASAYGGSEDIISHLRRLTVPVTVGLLFLSLVNYFARFCRWHLLSRQLRRVKVKSGVSEVSSSGNLIDLCHFDSIFKFDSDYQFGEVIETT